MFRKIEVDERRCKLMMSLLRMGFFVASVLVLDVGVDVLAAMGGRLAADDHGHAAEDGHGRDGDVKPNSQVIAGSLHCVTRDMGGHFTGVAVAAAPHQQSPLEVGYCVVHLTESRGGRYVFAGVGHGRTAVRHQPPLDELSDTSGCHLSDFLCFIKSG